MLTETGHGKSVPRIQQALRRAGWLVPVLWLALYVVGVRLFEVLELKTYDLRYGLMPPRSVPSRIVVVDIDTASLQRVGRFPWPRSKMAELVQGIAAHKPRTIVLDLVFDQPDLEAREAAEILREVARRTPPSLDLTNALARLEHDRRLGQAIARARPVVGGYFFIRNAHEASAVPAAERAARLTRLAGQALQLPAGVPVARLGLPQGFAAQVNIPEVASGMAGQGFFNILEDRDGTTRAMGHLIAADNAIYPSLSLQARAVLAGAGPPRLLLEEGAVRGVALGDDSVWLDPVGRQYLRFYGPARSFPYVSAMALLDRRAPAELLRDAVVFIGSSAFIQRDLKHTPTDTVFPGVEVHATALANLVEGVAIQHGGWWSLLDMTVIVAGGWLLYWALLRGSVVVAAWLIGVALVGAIGYATAALVWAGIWLNLVYPFGALLSVAVWALVYKYYAEERQRRWVRRAFAQYLSPALVEELAAHPERLALGGEERRVTVLFTDLRNFTAMSERMTASQVVAMMNEYFEAMSAQVLAQDGFVDKYIGDALMAIFGVPGERATDAASACRAALGMVRCLPEVNRRLTTLGFPAVDMGIGINSGAAVIGNLGSATKFNYTVIGDTVNTASRLEGLTKQYGVKILVGSETRHQIGNAMIFREVDWVLVKGRQQPIPVYELVGVPGQVPTTTREHLLAYEAGLRSYREQAWDEAAARWRPLARGDQPDGPASIMLARLQALRERPPIPQWNGVYAADSK